MADNPLNGPHLFGMSTGNGKTHTFMDDQVSSYTTKLQNKPRRQRPPIISDPTRFIGPKLKIERAKTHIRDFEAAAQAFFNNCPYELIHEKDPHTGQNVFRIIVKEGIPTSLGGFLGDAVHNLRCVFDYLVCDLIRANRSEPNGHSGLLIKRQAKQFEPGSIAKIKGVSPKAERFLLRLKADHGINNALWIIHWLDIIDKHNAIVPVAAATIQITVNVAMPGMFLGPDGSLGIGFGGAPMFSAASTPDHFRRVFPIENNVEVYRSLGDFQEQLEVAIELVFDQGKAAEGKPVVETLRQLTEFAERVVSTAERHLL